MVRHRGFSGPAGLSPFDALLGLAPGARCRSLPDDGQRPATSSISWARRRSIPSPPASPNISRKWASRPRWWNRPGTGGGMKLFCAGVGEGFPDIANASRPIKDSENATCQQNGVTDIVEVEIGYDGIVLAPPGAAPPRPLRARSLSGAGQGSAGQRRPSRQPLSACGRRSIRPCRPTRSKCWARRPPPVRAMRSWNW